MRLPFPKIFLLIALSLPLGSLASLGGGAIAQDAPVAAPAETAGQAAPQPASSRHEAGTGSAESRGPHRHDHLLIYQPQRCGTYQVGGERKRHSYHADMRSVERYPRLKFKIVCSSSEQSKGSAAVSPPYVAMNGDLGGIDHTCAAE